MQFKNKIKGAGSFFAVLLLLIFPGLSFSQEQKLADYNSIGWFTYTGTFKIKPKLAIHTEYQRRRVKTVKDRQQDLFRTGINYAIHKEVSLNAGYAFAETFPYGDFPNTSAFPEHRLFEQVILKQKINNIGVWHRFTLEQRFIGKTVVENNQKSTDWFPLNRMRYRVRTEIPVNFTTRKTNTWNIVLQDEFFIGWGKNIGTNIFDQNRIALLINFKLNNNVKIEAGYINQILQQGKRVDNKPVFQYNNGFTLATHLSFDFVN